MRTLLSCVLLVTYSGCFAADNKKDEKINAKLLVGRWKPKTENGPTEMEYTKDGKLKFTYRNGDKEFTGSVDYKVEGNQLVSMEESFGSKAEKRVAIIKLTDSELVIRDEESKTELMLTRIKDK